MALIRGVAPHMRDRAAYPTLGGGAGGRSLGSICNFLRSPAGATGLHLSETARALFFLWSDWGVPLL